MYTMSWSSRVLLSMLVEAYMLTCLYVVASVWSEQRLDNPVSGPVSGSVTTQMYNMSWNSQVLLSMLVEAYMLTCLYVVASVWSEQRLDNPVP